MSWGVVFSRFVDVLVVLKNSGTGVFLRVWKDFVGRSEVNVDIESCEGECTNVAGDVVGEDKRCDLLLILKEWYSAGFSNFTLIALSLV